jgi:hypothetical protein
MLEEEPCCARGVVDRGGRVLMGLGKLRPGVPDVVFGLVLGVGLVGGRSAFLNDPGTFWHVELGRQILQAGDVPRADTLTYTREGAAWVDQSWAFDVMLAAVVDHWGWSGAVAVSALGLAWLYGALARSLSQEGASPPVAAAVAVLAAGIGAIHFLARPHLLTFAFVFATLRLCRAYHASGDRAFWAVPALMVLWANVHGGFLAGPVIVATAALGHAVSGPWDAARMRRLAGFGVVFVLSVLAPLANPYGLGLYRHVIYLLFQSGLPEIIAEYQPAPFGHVEARILEWVVLALVALPSFSRQRMDRYDLAHTLVWMHLALGTARHIPLFALAVAPGLARLVDGLLTPSTDPEADRALGRWTWWPVVVSVGVLVAVGAGARLGRLDPRHWPLAAVAVLDRQPVSERLFHEQDWGGLIAAQCAPKRRTYLDDRFELFGKPALLEYLDALQGGPAWDALRDRHGFQLVWIRPDRPLARRLLAEPEWDVLYRDTVSILFRRRS